MFQDFIKDKDILSETHFKILISTTMQERNKTFYRVLMDSNLLPQTEIVNLACEYFAMHRINNPFKTLGTI